MQALAAVLEEKGLSVWTDRSGIEEGDAYDTQIEDAIAQTRVVIVVWSQHSVRSHWVRAEAAYALGKHKLVPITIDKSAPPLQFHHIQTIDFDGWNGAGHDEAFTRLLTVLAKRLDRAGALGGPALGAAAIPAQPKEPVAPPQASAKQTPFVRMFATGLMAAGLRFPEKVIERESPRLLQGSNVCNSATRIFAGLYHLHHLRRFRSGKRGGHKTPPAFATWSLVRCCWPSTF